MQKPSERIGQIASKYEVDMKFVVSNDKAMIVGIIDYLDEQYELSIQNNPMATKKTYPAKKKAVVAKKKVATKKKVVATKK